MGFQIDLTGMRFGKWSVLSFAGPNTAGVNYWRCKCDCGIEKNLAGSELKLGRTSGCRSCSMRQPWKNKFDFIGRYGVCTVSNGKQFIFDSDDYDIISRHTWTVDKNGYVLTKIFSIAILLHRMLLSPPDEMQIDHINLNPSDNRRSNLRLATNQQNVCNQPIDRENTSGYKGVSWHKMRSKWAAQIHVNGKHISLGLYDNKHSAAAVYNKAAQHYFGEFARINPIPNNIITTNLSPPAETKNSREKDPALEQSGAFSIWQKDGNQDAVKRA